MSIRTEILSLLDREEPKIDKVIKILDGTEEKFLALDTASLRLGVLEAIKKLKAGEDSYSVIEFLNGIAKGALDDIEDIDIDFDMPTINETSPFNEIDILTGTGEGATRLPGPDAALLNAISKRDVLTARKISGDIISEDDIQDFENTLIELGEALLPLLKNKFGDKLKSLL